MLKRLAKAVGLILGLSLPCLAGPSTPPAGNYITNVSSSASRQVFSVSSGTVGNITITGTCTGPGCFSGGGGGTPSGPSNSVQYNNTGSFAGSSNFQFSGSSVTIGGGLSVSTITMTGPGNLSFTNTNSPSTYQIVGSSTNATVASYAIFTSSWSIGTGPTPGGGGGNPGGNINDVQTNSNGSAFTGFDNLQNNGSTITISSVGTWAMSNVSTASYANTFITVISSLPTSQIFSAPNNYANLTDIEWTTGIQGTNTQAASSFNFFENTSASVNALADGIATYSFARDIPGSNGNLQGTESRVLGQGQAPFYEAQKSLAEWISPPTGEGTSGEIVGHEFQIIIASNDASTGISTGTVIGILEDKWTGSGAANQSWSMYMASTQPYFLDGQVGIGTAGPIAPLTIAVTTGTQYAVVVGSIPVLDTGISGPGAYTFTVSSGGYTTNSGMTTSGRIVLSSPTNTGDEINMPMTIQNSNIGIGNWYTGITYLNGALGQTGYQMGYKGGNTPTGFFWATNGVTDAMLSTTPLSSSGTLCVDQNLTMTTHCNTAQATLSSATLSAIAVNGPIVNTIGPVSLTSSGSNDSVTLFGTMTITNITVPPVGATNTYDLFAIYKTSNTSGNVMPSLFGESVNVSTALYSGGHTIGTLGLAADQGQGHLPLIGLEGRTNGSGAGFSNEGALGLATHIDAGIVGATTTVIGLEARTEMYANDGTTVESSGAVVGLVIQPPKGSGAGTATYGMVGFSTFPYLINGNVTINPNGFTDIGFGSPWTTLPSVNPSTLFINSQQNLNAGILLESGNAVNYAVQQIGRTSADATFGVAGAANNFLTGTAPGDMFFRQEGVGRKFAFGAVAGTPSFIVNGGSVTVNGQEVIISSTFVSGFELSVSSASSNFHVAISTEGHVLTDGSTPATSSCGTNSIIGTDTFFEVNVTGGTPGSCTITYGRPYLAVPMLVCNQQTGNITNTFSFSTSASAVTLTETSMSGKYDCYVNGNKK